MCGPAHPLLHSSARSFAYMPTPGDCPSRQAKEKRIKKLVANQECVAAYVVFNEHQSLSRALQDYKRFYGWRYDIVAEPMASCICRTKHLTPPLHLRSCFMPKQLRFRGKHAIKVKHADNPSNIIWENQDTSRVQQACRRGVAIVLMLALLFISVACIFFATLKKSDAAKR